MRQTWFTIHYGEIKTEFRVDIEGFESLFTIHYGEIKTFDIVSVRVSLWNLQSTMVRLRPLRRRVDFLRIVFTIHYGEIKTHATAALYAKSV